MDYVQARKARKETKFGLLLNKTAVISNVITH